MNVYILTIHYILSETSTGCYIISSPVSCKLHDVALAGAKQQEHKQQITLALAGAKQQ